MLGVSTFLQKMDARANASNASPDLSKCTNKRRADLSMCPCQPFGHGHGWAKATTTTTKEKEGKRKKDLLVLLPHPLWIVQAVVILANRIILYRLPYIYFAICLSNNKDKNSYNLILVFN